VLRLPADGNGSSPLMWATSKQRVDVVAELLTRGADPNLTNDYG
jgi:ankyrin repeat protein